MLASVLALLLLASIPIAARAQDDAPPAESAPDAPPPPPPEAIERFERGSALFEEGNYDAALTELQRAYDLIGDHPNRDMLLYDIGRCYEARFAYDRALRFYERYLASSAPTADERIEVRERIEAMEERMARVEVDVNLPEVELWVDGRPAGIAPGVVRIPAGQHVLRVRAPGYLPAEREVQVPAGSTLQVTLRLEPASGFRGLHPAIVLSTAGLAAVALGLGVGFGVDATSTHSALDRRLSSDLERWDVAQAEIDRVSDLALVADVFLATSLVLVATSVVLGLLTQWSDDEQTEGAIAVAPLVGPGIAGLTAGGRW